MLLQTGLEAGFNFYHMYYNHRNRRLDVLSEKWITPIPKIGLVLRLYMYIKTTNTLDYGSIHLTAINFPLIVAPNVT
uniref:Uncharacterized protein n=1 Tax=Pararge aegeria TaxID=116150 RepID=S4P6W3_9NEOP